MSSLINQTTGECISGTCVSMELFSKIPWYGWLGIILVGAILIELAVIINCSPDKKWYSKNKNI